MLPSNNEFRMAGLQRQFVLNLYDVTCSCAFPTWSNILPIFMIRTGFIWTRLNHCWYERGHLKILNITWSKNVEKSCYNISGSQSMLFTWQPRWLNLPRIVFYVECHKKKAYVLFRIQKKYKSNSTVSQLTTYPQKTDTRLKK